MPKQISHSNNNEKESDFLNERILGFNPHEVRKKYAEERSKRLRSDGNNQYIETTGNFEDYNTDPHVESGFSRKAVEKSTDVVILGGGISGLLTASRLCRAGITDLCIFDKAGDFGGVWYWNRYPGAQCDTESYIYMPLLEETGYIPSERYAHQPEIYSHLQRIGKHFKLYEKAFFQTQVLEMRWLDKEKRWRVETDRNDIVKARFVVMASGPLHRPKLPAISGLENFKGKSFHTCRWDYQYTGGDTSGGMIGLRDKRVGIVGTGATGVQVLPNVAPFAKKLYLFQRTPAPVDERNNQKTDMSWAKSLPEGWQAERDENFCSIMGGLEVEKDLVNDKWTDFFRLAFEILDTGNVDGVTPEALALKREIADFKKGHQIRERVNRLVKDPKTAENLKHWFGQWCKRPTFHDEYLQAFNRPNVQLVDTNGKGIERITETAVIVNGDKYDVDCLIFATGFEVGTSYTRRSQCEVYGVNGKTLSEHWQDGMSTYHGFLTRDFPNCLHMGLTQTGVAFNYTFTANGQAEHAAYLISEVLRRGAQSIEAQPEAEKNYQDLVKAPGPMRKYQETCTPGYYNVEGENTGQSFIDNHYPEGAVNFFKMLSKWREEGKLSGLILK